MLISGRYQVCNSDISDIRGVLGVRESGYMQFTNVDIRLISSVYLWYQWYQRGFRGWESLAICSSPMLISGRYQVCISDIGDIREVLETERVWPYAGYHCWYLADIKYVSLISVISEGFWRLREPVHMQFTNVDIRQISSVYFWYQWYQRGIGKAEIVLLYAVHQCRYQADIECVSPVELCW